MSVLWWLSVCSLLETAHPVRSFALSFHIPSSSQILKPVVFVFFFPLLLNFMETLPLIFSENPINNKKDH